MAHGGKRQGAGRPPKVEEEKVRSLSLSAIQSIYGSEENGFKALLESGDPGLKKWVFEHAYGKPTDKVDMTSAGEKIGGVQVEVLRAIHHAHAEAAN